MMYETCEDKQLIEKITSQDREALGALYDRYGGTVYSLAMHMLKDSGAAEEVAQDVFFNIWRKASSYHSQKGTVTAWLFSIAHHRAIDEVRRRKRDRTYVQHGVDLSNRPMENGGDPVEFTKLQFERSHLKDALGNLRPEQREVVVLAYFGGLTHSEISKRLDQPLGTVKTRMRLAIKKLRELLGPNVREWVDNEV